MNSCTHLGLETFVELDAAIAARGRKFLWSSTGRQRHNESPLLIKIIPYNCSYVCAAGAAGQYLLGYPPEIRAHNLPGLAPLGITSPSAAQRPSAGLYPLRQRASQELRKLDGARRSLNTSRTERAPKFILCTRRASWQRLHGMAKQWLTQHATWNGGAFSPSANASRRRKRAPMQQGISRQHHAPAQIHPSSPTNSAVLLTSTHGQQHPRKHISRSSAH